MKLYLFLFLFLIANFHSNAQADFIQPNAEWHYNTLRGSFRQYVFGDTTYQGKSCKLIRHDKACIDSLWFYMGFWLSTPPDIYLYNSNDTVFVFNHIFNKFTPLYIFNVNAGDTICLPLLPTVGKPINPWGDSTFCIVIDSVKTEIYDTTSLKTVYSSPVASTVRNELEYGKFTWRIGTPEGLLPRCVNHCAYLASDNIGYDDPIRCYSDNTISVKYVSGNCQRGISLSIDKAMAIDNNIRVFPNPVSDAATIDITGGRNIEAINIVDVTGRIMHSQKAPGKEISVKALENGIYYLQLLVGGSVIVKKISVQH